MKTILKNLENYGQLTLSIAYLKVLYYSIMNEVIVSVRNTTGNDFALIMRIDSKDVEKWVDQMSANHGFKY